MPTTSFRIREELVDLVLRDLVGPAAGPDEEITETNVRDRYLTGMLAPRKQADVLTDEELDELAEGGADTLDDGNPEPSVPAVRTLAPSSFGMSFCVGLEATSMRIRAWWGQYLKEANENGRYWKRHRRGGESASIPLKEGALEEIVPDRECPEVVVRGRVRRRSDHFSVTLFLTNGQEEPKKNRDESWLFQAELEAAGDNGEAIFSRRQTCKRRTKVEPGAQLEDSTMEMLYRESLEFAVGHGVSVDWDLTEGRTDRALRVRTRVAPVEFVRRVSPPTKQEEPLLAGLVTDMKELAEASNVTAVLKSLPVAYREWIKGLASRLGDLDLEPYREAAKKTVDRANTACDRIQAGIDLLASDPDALAAFRFANEAMWRQRVRSLWIEAKRQGSTEPLEAFDVPNNRSWYPFQLAFILLNLPGVTKLDHEDRTSETTGTCDLLWFPTGGGKTEAYLGLAAYTIGLRRLQGAVGGRDGENGLAVFMRYTLRLLTLQQFQRASALICACEVIRRSDPKWGNVPFRLGLWVGQKSTPNTTAQSQEVIEGNRGRDFRPVPGVGSPHQLTSCPWCGTAIDPGQHIEVDRYPTGSARTLVYCGDRLGECAFSKRNAKNEGLPVIVVDEEIYRRLPCMLIATVDKFAQMAWTGEIQMLFGQVQSYCERHGFRSPEVTDADSHNAAGAMPKARSRPVAPLRPPDLIIQDELHLISGPLGTLVGQYETAIDQLCTWEVGGKKVRPKVIASTATIRRASDQVSAVFLRRLSVFPPSGLDASDNFFARERAIGETDPGRMYLGICAPGKRLKAALIRVYVAFLSAAQNIYERHGVDADAFMTLVGYFNSLRELGGMRRLVDDDVRSRLRKMDERGLAKRTIYPGESIEELTSRRASTEIPTLLDRMGLKFDPAEEQERRERARQDLKPLRRRPLDVLLATNMISVGVDVRRLGLMVVAGQPKSTSEYIQATSRVGRNTPGIVCTVYNWARPRDLSHYESFRHYHGTFYQHVEALSVTPFSAGAIFRALTGVLVSYIRQAGVEFNENSTAARIRKDHPIVRRAVEEISRRAKLAGGRADLGETVQLALEQRLDYWAQEAQNRAGGRILAYQQSRDGVTVGLLRKPGADAWTEFTCLNSLREVEPEAFLIFQDSGMDNAPPPFVGPPDEVVDEQEVADGE